MLNARLVGAHVFLTTYFAKEGADLGEAEGTLEAHRELASKLGGCCMILALEWSCATGSGRRSSAGTKTGPHVPENSEDSVAARRRSSSTKWCMSQLCNGSEDDGDPAGPVHRQDRGVIP